MFECKTCKAYREFLENRNSEMERLRLDLKETVQKLNDSLEREAAARDRLEEMILRFARIIPTDSTTTVKTSPVPIQRKSWDRTKVKLEDEIEKDWKRKIEEEERIISNLNASTGTKSRDIDAVGETKGLDQRYNLSGKKS